MKVKAEGKPGGVYSSRQAEQKQLSSSSSSVSVVLVRRFKTACGGAELVSVVRYRDAVLLEGGGCTDVVLLVYWSFTTDSAKLN
jgi:hypothetical protein